MTVRKRNEYLDIESSEGEGSDGGYDSEAAQEAKGKGKGKGKVTGRATKRRKLSVSASEFASEDEGGVGAVNGRDSTGGRGVGLLSAEEDRDEDEVRNNADTDGEEVNADGEKDEKNGGGEEEEEGYQEYDSQSDQKPASATSSTAPNTKSKPLKPKETRKKNKTGVIYFSSLPPYLKPSALKSLLTQRGFSPITKIFLSPYVPPNASSSTTTGKRASSNRRRTYTDGWVEFASKRTAKICAETLNATIVGGKKGGWYHDDVWNIKYLRGFKWADLMEQVQRERAEREARRRIEDARARREERAFLAGVERGKVVEGIRRKRAEKAKVVEGEKAAGGNVDGVGAGEEKGFKAKVDLDVRRVFRQNEVLGSGKARDRGEKALDADAKRVLGKIF
ncbi:hypothetical protein ACJ73_10116 [Blastomyces percursus]|uniref:Pre-rRNA-processing protein ESF2 n=1 Tax=Blastomyces percursus TaxID=1658174 RepID=A0A1J9Q3K6_9EURO|nr:hypothetical protein ACJ73_10116 [Blastomyces percursus]